MKGKHCKVKQVTCKKEEKLVYTKSVIEKVIMLNIHLSYTVDHILAILGGIDIVDGNSISKVCSEQPDTVQYNLDRALELADMRAYYIRTKVRDLLQWLDTSVMGKEKEDN